ncbi:MAG: transcription elongation factor GreA [Candidatus Moranbacteria bacterium CG_4_10_14_3_um_filter_44_15]|nr:MAG: transcription elongation factor GreA [Candidatus Moranbacteria bacterium CG06_land_8_20_14_3_00_43_56]PIV83411.1 MAG: transcription elongation factor GreA [Candidatus Moranbacteria bacterium CG17_big_fil_post_rev_8_21_14_2_50_44_12]PIW93522.1 MAG: transcription elongation factor GreA [Candidatus Moranbacteria bacterium CG_4_8_14_3_um_filter_43_15]PIX90933.1 MAG: transcription elongation factor GreA [Candidatus Moranbacteria bacterium CG_4_10_14_3_um_filter_44_15]PJA86168.1 MAG: transcri
MTTFLTPEGHKKLEEELEMRKREMRQKIAEIIKEAKEQGDLSENAEYTEAKRQQADNERRIMELENIIRTSQVSSFDKKSKVVQMGSRVAVKFNGEEQAFDIVGSNEADPLNGRVSNESPIGKALLGKKAGEKAMVQTPSGEKEYRILEVK